MRELIVGWIEVKLLIYEFKSKMERADPVLKSN